MKPSTLFSYLILIIAFMSVNQWSAIPIGNDFVYFLLSFSILLLIIYHHRNYPSKINSKNYLLLIYLLWATIAIVRGIFVAENYWEWKAWVQNTLAVLLPLLMFFFVHKTTLHNTLRLWVKYALPLFVFFAAFLIKPCTYGFYLGPIFLLGIFFPVLTNHWRLIFIAFFFILLIAIDINRSTGIKTAVLFLILLFYRFRHIVSLKLLKPLHIGLYLVPILLLYIGLTGIFNVFEMDKYIKISSEENELTVDTRSFIYDEQVISALQNNYLIWGRTPARGFDSIYGEAAAMAIYDAGNSKGANLKFERTSCEVVHLNIFNYLGIIGVILYSLLYFQSSYLAINKSNNIFIKMLGLYIAFHWGYGWVEDFNRFDIMNISLWMMIAMGYSPQFRMMTNGEITLWVRGIFDIRYKYLANESKQTDHSRTDNQPQPQSQKHQLVWRRFINV